jgi:hypothetical protein
VVVADSNTVIDPGTMMVEAFNTLIADAAMTRPLSSNDLTIWAKQYRIKIFKHSLYGTFRSEFICYQEGDVIRFFKISWISAS